MKKQCINCFGFYDDDLEMCPHCGFVAGEKASDSLHMNPGEVLSNRYHIGKVLGYGGFGVTYLSWDEVLQSLVAIKEYLPIELASRNNNEKELIIFSGEKEERFKAGLDKFVDEAKRLAVFQNESGIVCVYNYFFENKTAYIVMEYIDGETLASYVEKHGLFTTEKANELLLPVIKTLDKLHKSGVIHRDIALDNIMITKDEELKLIDFGAARYVTATDEYSLTVMVKEGFSPEEQYRSHSQQGAYTDVYALACVYYKLITGVVPPNPMDRLALLENGKKDSLVEPQKYVKKLSKNINIALLNALNVKAKDRTPDMSTFMAEMMLDDVTYKRDPVIDVEDKFKWPLWVKILISSVVAGIIVVAVLFATGVIGKTHKDDTAEIPEGMTRVPFVVNQEKKEAKGHIIEANLISQIIDKQYSLDIDKNLVLKQSISGGKVVDINDTVGVVISGGERMQLVPDEFGIEKKEAERELKDIGFGVTYVEQYGAIKPDFVIAVEHVDEEVKYGSDIKVTVSKGIESFDPSKTVEMPKVVGLYFDEAMEKMLDSKLTMSKSEGRYSENIEKGIIIEQSVRSGTTVNEGDNIEVVISLGPHTVHMPDVQYKSCEEAEKILTALGFKVVCENIDSDDVYKGRVVEQSVMPGFDIDFESEVTIYISNGNVNAKPLEEILADLRMTEEEMGILPEETEAEESSIVEVETEDMTETVMETEDDIQLKQAMYDGYLKILNDKYYAFQYYDRFSNTAEVLDDKNDAAVLKSVSIGDINGDNVEELIITTFDPVLHTDAQSGNVVTSEHNKVYIEKLAYGMNFMDFSKTEIYSYIDAEIKRIFVADNRLIGFANIATEGENSIIYYYDGYIIVEHILGMEYGAEYKVYKYDEVINQYAEIVNNEEILSGLSGVLGNEKYMIDGHGIAGASDMLDMTYLEAVDYLVNDCQCEYTDLDNIDNYLELGPELVEAIYHTLIVTNYDWGFYQLDLNNSYIEKFDSNGDGIDELLIDYSIHTSDDDFWFGEGLNEISFILENREGSYKCVQTGREFYNGMSEDGVIYLENNLIIEESGNLNHQYFTYYVVSDGKIEHIGDKERHREFGLSEREYNEIANNQHIKIINTITDGSSYDVEYEISEGDIEKYRDKDFSADKVMITELV